MRTTVRQLNRLSFELRRLVAAGGFSALIILVLYAAPTGLEALLIPHLGPRLACGLIGDSASYLLLFFLGFRRIATAVYLFSKATEIALLESQIISPQSLLWVTDLFPTVVCAGLLCWMVFFSRDEAFPRCASD